jgi:hypothetical protein
MCATWIMLPLINSMCNLLVQPSQLIDLELYLITSMNANGYSIMCIC